MAHIEMIAEDEAMGKTKEIYEDIKLSLKIDFVSILVLPVILTIPPAPDTSQRINPN